MSNIRQLIKLYQSIKMLMYQYNNNYNKDYLISIRKLLKKEMNTTAHGFFFNINVVLIVLLVVNINIIII